MKRTLDRRKKGKEKFRCGICGSTHTIISSYGLGVCRKCFREVAEKIGFRKY